MPIDYFKKDIEAEKVYPINPMFETKVTHGELLLRHAKFYDYKRLWDWKLDQQRKELRATTAKALHRDMHIPISTESKKDIAWNVAIDYLDKVKLEYTIKNWAMYISHPTDDWQAYQYYPTTNRWASMVNRKNKYRKHYSCRGIEDLVTRFILAKDTRDASRA